MLRVSRLALAAALSLSVAAPALAADTKPVVVTSA